MIYHDVFPREFVHSREIKPSFHPNAIACVGKQPIMAATASTEHPTDCKSSALVQSYKHCGKLFVRIFNLTSVFYQIALRLAAACSQ